MVALLISLFELTVLVIRANKTKPMLLLMVSGSCSHNRSGIKLTVDYLFNVKRKGGKVAKK